MTTIEVIGFCYLAIGSLTALWETIQEDNAWHGMACGILWPVFPLKAAIAVIIGLFQSTNKKKKI